MLSRYGYENIRLLIVEQTDLSRAIGGATDIVEKEMYSFADKSEPPTLLTLPGGYCWSNARGYRHTHYVVTILSRGTSVP
jgi:hypothetical protein